MRMDMPHAFLQDGVAAWHSALRLPHLLCSCCCHTLASCCRKLACFDFCFMTMTWGNSTICGSRVIRLLMEQGGLELFCCGILTHEPFM